MDFAWLEQLEEGWRPVRHGWWLQRTSWKDLFRHTHATTDRHQLVSEFRQWADSRHRYQYVLTWDGPLATAPHVYLVRKEFSSRRTYKPGEAFTRPAGHITTG